ncbi:hypothetical protein RJT34_00103 [Clitoria ternatea]|uniref:Myb-like domain-containing protein n=1 Tax=Clitoria ternatea TaxID=43366 RepID=A0AAN9PZ42_CLITE
MRTKTIGKRKRVSSSTAPSFPDIHRRPDEKNDTVFDTDGDDDNSTPHRPEPEPALEPLDFLDKTICIICNNRGEERVLVCTQSGCPVTVHASCIGSEPSFDDASGNFYCPYCYYKRTVDTCQKLRQNAMIAKKALSRFLDKNEPPPNARAASPVQGSANPVQDTPGTEGLQKEEEEERLIEETESEEDQDEVEVSETGSSWNETDDSESVAVFMRKRMDKKKKKKEEERQSKRYPVQVWVIHQIICSVVVMKMVGNCGCRLEFETMHIAATATTTEIMKRPSVNSKRKRLLWTDEEEKALKAGVLMFSKGNKNIPWRKILEFGVRVFDKTRVPADLKDKWKNIISKEGRISIIAIFMICDKQIFRPLFHYLFYIYALEILRSLLASGFY